MFKIGEFSKLTQVTVRMLRYYDEMGLLKPAQIDAFSGYRLYTTAQIPILNKIVYLRDSGFQVAEIAAFLKEEDETSIIHQLEKKHQEVQKSIEAAQEKLGKITLAKQELQTHKTEFHYHISIKAIPSYRVLSLRKIIPNYYEEGTLWKELASLAKDSKGVPLSDSTKTFAIYHDLEHKEQNVDVELCAILETPIDPKTPLVIRETEAVAHMATTMVYGSFSNIAGVYLSFAKWLEEHSQHHMAGTSRQIVHRGPWNEENPEQYLTEIQIPLTTPS